MRNPTAVATVILLGLTQAVFAGGPSIRSKAAAVKSVVSDEAKILMIISGKCEILLSDSTLPPELGNAKYVETDMLDCVVTIVRADKPGSGYENWQEHCRKADSLVGKLAWIDLQGSITIDQAVVTAVRATASGFALAKAADGPTESRS